MDSSTRPVRTYSRRQSTKSATGSVAASPDYRGGGRIASSSRFSDNDDDDDERPRKRRKLLDASHDTYSPASLLESPSKGKGRSLDRSPELPLSPAHERSPDVNSTPKGKGRSLNRYLKNSIDRTSSLPTVLRDVSPSASESSASHLTTPKKPKDLSRIFEAASPQRRTQPQGDSPLSSPKRSGITKKMLSRSRTESSIESSPSRTTNLTPKSKSFVLPLETNTPSGKDGYPSSSPNKELSRNLSQSPVVSGVQQPQRESTSNSRTYAGTSRSFLVALPAAALLSRTGEPGSNQDSQDGDDEEYLRDSYAELRKRYGIDNSDGINITSGEVESTGEGLSLYNPLSSITDLRSKGESRRFRDEVGYLFEGLEPSGALSVRRSSAFDIVSKLCDQEFWRKAKAAGLISEIWDRLRDAGAGNGDKVLDPILCCFVSLASEDPRDVSLLASKDDFVETVVQMLATHGANDPLASTGHTNKMNLGRAETTTLNRLRDIMSAKTSIVPRDCQPSTRLLLSCTFASAPSLAFPHISVLLDTVAGDLASISSRLAAYQSGLSLFPDMVPPNLSHEKLCFGHIYNCLAILDLYLIEAEAFESSMDLSRTDLRQRHRALPTGLVVLLVVADIVNRTDSPHALHRQASRCSELVFRILINLTNSSSTWTDAVAADPYTLPTTIRLIMTSHHAVLKSDAKKSSIDAPTKDHDATTSPIDRLCLALALLTNLLQERDNLAYSLQNIMFDPACAGQRPCLLGCRCKNSMSAVSGLVGMYISFLKSEEDDLAPDLHFLRGHLAVLIGLLLLQLHNPDLPKLSSFPPQSVPLSSSQTPFHSIIDDLPGPTKSIAPKLDALITNIDEFSHLYASLTSKVGRSGHSLSRRTGSGDEGGSDDIVTQGRNSCGSESDSGSGADVVAGVAASLRTLRAELRDS